MGAIGAIIRYRTLDSPPTALPGHVEGFFGLFCRSHGLFRTGLGPRTLDGMPVAGKQPHDEERAGRYGDIGEIEGGPAQAFQVDIHIVSDALVAESKEGYGERTTGRRAIR